jgi:hypothetical protein
VSPASTRALTMHPTDWLPAGHSLDREHCASSNQQFQPGAWPCSNGFEVGQAQAELRVGGIVENSLAPVLRLPPIPRTASFSCPAPCRRSDRIPRRTSCASSGFERHGLPFLGTLSSGRAPGSNPGHAVVVSMFH